jgi:hypothetical protein
MHNASSASIIDSLESRQLFANVALSFAEGQLNLIGSNSADAVTILVKGDTLAVRAARGTTINGSSADMLFNKWAVTTLFAQMRGGNDTVNINEVDQGIGGTIDTGAGADVVTIVNSVLGSALVQTGDDADVLAVWSSRMINVTADTGRGNDLAAVYGNTVFGHSSLVLGDGDDTLLVAKTTVFGFTSITAGAGRDTAIGWKNDLVGGVFLNGFERTIGSI